jgi:hypothetical protein
LYEAKVKPLLPLMNNKENKIKPDDINLHVLHLKQPLCHEALHAASFSAV